VIFLALMCTVSMTIATLFALLGAWMIFPFAGLEMLVLAAALYYCACRGSEREVVTVGDDMVAVARGRRCPTTNHEFQRAWARVRLEKPVNHWYPSRLMICSHGREVEVGRCLNEEERRQLAADLTTAIRWQGSATSIA
jgi:uncharacterized membrane protein